MNAPNRTMEQDGLRRVGAADTASVSRAATARGRSAKAGRPAASDCASVRERLLDEALDLICKRGFNGFSYRDLSERVGVKTSSIHYYFATKEDLALEAVKEYSARVARHIDGIDASLPASEQAERYLQPWRSQCRSEMVCLVGMLASESESMPPNVTAALQDFYRMNEGWLAGLLERARSEAEGEMPAERSPSELAQILFAALQQSLVSARLFDRLDRIEPAARLLLAAVSGSGGADEIRTGALAAAD